MDKAEGERESKGQEQHHRLCVSPLSPSPSPLSLSPGPAKSNCARAPSPTSHHHTLPTYRDSSYSHTRVLKSSHHEHHSSQAGTHRLIPSRERREENRKGRRRPSKLSLSLHPNADCDRTRALFARADCSSLRARTSSSHHSPRTTRSLVRLSPLARRQREGAQHTHTHPLPPSLPPSFALQKRARLRGGGRRIGLRAFPVAPQTC